MTVPILLLALLVRDKDPQTLDEALQATRKVDSYSFEFYQGDRRRGRSEWDAGRMMDLSATAIHRSVKWVANAAT